MARILGYKTDSISIHAPREGGDPKKPHWHVLWRYISIHAPREGGDLFNSVSWSTI